MSAPIENSFDDSEPNETPHRLVSDLITVGTESQRKKLAEEICEKLNLEPMEAETLVTSAANLSQLKAAISRVATKRVGKHTFSFIEYDVVTWRILPSPENIRFEDKRLGSQNAFRFSSLPGAAPVLYMSVPKATDLIEDLEIASGEILKDNPHTATIQHRGIEVGGVLSLARIQAEDMSLPIGVLDATDGFSRTVGAHIGRLVDLRDESDDRQLSTDDERRLRSAVMPRAQVIIGYHLRGAESQPNSRYDKARRTLVGHIHMAPAHAFSPATQAAAKANAIREALTDSNSLPAISGLTPEQISETLGGNLRFWIEAGYGLDEFALLVLEVYKPALQSKLGKTIKAAIEDLTGQNVTSEDLAEIAAEVALRPALIAKSLPKVHLDQQATMLRSTLTKAWNTTLVSGLQFSQRSVGALLEGSLAELKLDASQISSGRVTSGSARAELAALASFNMIALAEKPLLERAVGRSGYGNNDEPSKVLSELIKSSRGVKQLAQVIFDIRAGRLPRLIREIDEVSDAVTEVDRPLADTSSIKEIYIQPANDPNEPALSPTEQVNNHLRELNHLLNRLEDAVRIIDEMDNELGVKIVLNDGLPVKNEIDVIQRLIGRLYAWNTNAEQAVTNRKSNLDTTELLG
jgi:hypothetical protein